jgi:hypothetical protein
MPDISPRLYSTQERDSATPLASSQTVLASPPMLHRWFPQRILIR